ncbi:MAG: cupin domain-containing protein [Granulosicoccus sp.]
MCDTNSKGSAVPTVYVNNDCTRVTEWRFLQKGDNTGWHTHEFDYVVVPLFDGTLEIENQDGTRSIAALKNGVPYYRDLGVRHDVINGNDFECAFVEIEFLRK